MTRQSKAGLTRRTAFAAGAAAFAAPGAALSAETEPLAEAAGLNGAVLVRRGSAPARVRCFGMADISFAVPIQPDTRFAIASITKLFTSAAVLILRDRGALSLEAPASAYLPGLRLEGAEAVPLRNLLNNTSGLPNPDSGLGYDRALREGVPLFQNLMSPEELTARFAHGPLLRPTGTAFDYNNADYFLLGRVIEAVSGASYEEVLRRLILHPLGLGDTGLCRHDRIVARLAELYFRAPGAEALGRGLPVYPENWYAAGAMYSSVSDLARFADALFGGALVSANALTELTTAGLGDYGLGLWIWNDEIAGRRRRIAVRFGGIMGANGVLYRLLDDGLTIVVLANTNDADMGALARALAEHELRA